MSESDADDDYLDSVEEIEESDEMASKVSVNSPAVGWLKGRENYNDWSFAVQMLLKLEGLWKTVQPQQDGVVDPDKDEMALARIVLLVDPSAYVRLRKKHGINFVLHMKFLDFHDALV